MMTREEMVVRGEMVEKGEMVKQGEMVETKFPLHAALGIPAHPPTQPARVASQWAWPRYYPPLLLHCSKLKFNIRIHNQSPIRGGGVINGQLVWYVNISLIEKS